jgi:RHS repeat-associated protein
VVQLFDQAGVVTTEGYDFKGNLLQSQRQFAREYKATLDWSTAVSLEPAVYTSGTRYDALNRPTEQIAPDSSVYRPTFNEANLLEKVDVNLRGAAVSTPFVTDIDYNAKGQRSLSEYGNGVRTTYEYDPLTFRLTRLTTTRPGGLNGLATQLFKNVGTVQDLNYTYDPAGNITHIADDALPTLFFANQQVDPVGLYTYDAVYRLIQAEGRESIGQSALQLALPQATYRDYPYAGLGFQPFDPKAVRNYTERYEYDEVGNFLHMIHQAQNGAWRRDYRYEEGSLVEPGKFSNRLSATVLHPNGSQPLNERYTHDSHGNMTAMPHLTLMQWDFKDQLRSTARQAVNEGTPETTYHVYDATGQRVRKITERRNGTRKNERIYLGGFEVFREYGGDGASVTLERESLHVMDNQQCIALVETRTKGNDGSPTQIVRYQLANHLGSASLELDGAGQIISYEEYYPYGSTSYQAGRTAAEVNLKRYRYTGKERDEETGFNYHAARYYAPWVARWVSVDPERSQFPDWSSFCYVFANPLVFVDPAGTAPHGLTEDQAELVSQVDDWVKRFDEFGKAQHELRDAQASLGLLRGEMRASAPTESQLRTLEALTRRVEAANRTLQGLETTEAKLVSEGRRLLGNILTRFPETNVEIGAPGRGGLNPRADLLGKVNVRLPPPPPPSGGGVGGLAKALWEGAKRFFGITGRAVGNIVKWGGKALPWLSVLTAKDEGEAGFAVFSIAVCASHPAVTLGCTIIGLGALGAYLYDRWKGPTADVPKIEFPPSEEAVGPVREVAHESLPPGSGSPAPNRLTIQGKSLEPSGPNTLRMREESNPSKKTRQPSMSITKGAYD